MIGVFAAVAGLAMLLMVTMFPILVALGVSRISATAAIATTLCLDWSPSDTGTIFAAEIAGFELRRDGRVKQDLQGLLHTLRAAAQILRDADHAAIGLEQRFKRHAGRPGRALSRVAGKGDRGFSAGGAGTRRAFARMILCFRRSDGIIYL